MNNKQFSNEPNLQNDQMNLSVVKEGDYENKRLAEHRKNEPNSNPICCGYTVVASSSARPEQGAATSKDLSKIVIARSMPHRGKATRQSSFMSFEFLNKYVTNGLVFDNLKIYGC